MTTSSLFKEIETLNKDIDTCKDRLGSNANKKNACPPNCYCDNKSKMDNRNMVAYTRKKTASATVTKMDITPRFYQEKEAPSKSKGNLRKASSRPKTASDDTYVENECIEFTCCPKSKVTTTSQGNGKSLREEQYLCADYVAEPVRLPKKSSRVKNEPSWSTVLKQNIRRDIKENIDFNLISRKDECTQVNYNSSSSPVSSVNVETRPIYMKNKGIQCEEICKDKLILSNDGPLNTIQYLIMNMKSKLKASPDPSLGSMLNEMELALRKVPLDRGDSQATSDKARRTSCIENYLHPRPDFHQLQKMHPDKMHREILEATYLEVEAACGKLKKERDAAVERASKKSIELVESMRREVETKTKLSETNSKIKEMSAKLETYTKSMEGLTEHIRRLQNENKDIDKIRGQIVQLSSMMRDVTQENKSLLAELQLVTIERNQLEVALAIKEQELEKKSKELESISQLLLETTKCSRLSTGKNKKKQCPATPDHMNSLNIPSHRNETLHSPRLVTSSPNSSSTDPVQRRRFDSWIACSTITSVDEEKGKNNESQVTNQPPTNKETVTAAENNKLFEQSSSSTAQRLQPSEQVEKRPDLNKIEKLKEDIRRMFSEMRELAQGVPSLPAVEYSAMGDSSDMNWSEMSNTVNSYDSISELQSVEFNEILNQIK